VKLNLNQTNTAFPMAKFLKSHHSLIGLLLLFFGVASLSLIMPNIWNSEGQWQGFYILMPQWRFTVPALLVTSLIGTLIVCFYVAGNLQSQKVDNREYVAMLLTALGFTYQVIGAWPLWNQAYPWPWQKEIAGYGNLLVLPLFACSLLALVIGAASLYVHSKNTGLNE
jgi:uncharacterized membrane protein